MSDTDWARTVRTLRARLNLNQAGFARLVDVSQTYISRIESGRLTPTPRVAEAIRALAANPRTRSAFDDFVASVRYSPYASCLGGRGPDGFEVIAVSDAFLDRFGPPESAIVEGTAFDTAFRALLEAGVLDGDIDRADCLFKLEDASSPYWRAVVTPIRDETGEWFIHGTLREIDAAKYEDRLAAQGGETMILIRLGPDPKND